MNKNLQSHTHCRIITLKKLALILGVLALGLLSALSASATVYYVSPSGNNASAGTSWATAKADLQDAINATSSGDKIWIKAGTYKPTRLPATGTASTSRDVSFYLNKNIKIYGGFDGTETALADRDIDANPVVLSGNIGTAASTDNCYHVLITKGLSSSAVIDGLTIQDGNANGSSSYNYNGSGYNRIYGGGMYNRSSSSPSIANITFNGNYASGGGGMYNLSSSPRITNATFRGNDANYGGGMYNSSSSPSITNATFSGNEATFNGGGMYNSSSSPIITNATFIGNKANSGGGMMNDDSSTPGITNATFSGNEGTYKGGGIYNYSSSPSITNSIFWDNKKGTTPSATVAGADIENTISSPTVTYCLTQQNSTYSTGTGIINNQDPLFLDSADPDGPDNVWMTGDDGLILKPTSPAEDVGSNSSIPAGITADIIGSTRIQNTTVNIGAYEITKCNIVTRLYVDIGATSGGNTGLSWTDAFIDLQEAINCADAGDSIWVATGTYKPSSVPTGVTSTNPREKTFYLDKDIKIYGGFDGTETALMDRDITANPVVLSGDIGTATVSTDNCYHVLITTGLSSAAVIDGFTIEDGKANSTSWYFYSGKEFHGYSGGGMYNRSSAPRITNATFSGNQATYGGGMYNSGSLPVLTNVMFSSNEASSGGGMYNSSSSLSITNATFSSNVANSKGGGMYNNNSSSSVNNVTFSGNEARSGGGGMYNEFYSSPSISNSIFWGNKKGTTPSTTVAGADIQNSSSTPTVTYCLTQQNSTYSTGTGIVNNQDPLFVNSADPDGADNVWMTADDGLILKPGSPAEDVGRNDSIPSGITTDIIGSDRIQSTTVNMGAYEDTECNFVTRLYVDISASSGGNTGLSWTDAFIDLQEAINCADAGDSIWIAAGTYKPSSVATGVTSTDPRDRTFYLDKDLLIYGGFDGTETALIDRDIAANPVVLSGDIGTTTVSTDNCYHVMITEGLSSAAEIDGLAIQHGRANGTGSYTYSGRVFYRTNGGGMYHETSSPSITNVTFSGNEADDYGGGMYHETSSPSITNATFSGNEAGSGGGLYNRNSSPSITNATFSSNEASNGGGGIFNFLLSSPSITNSIFWGNTKGTSTTVAGADIEDAFSSTPTVTYCLTQQNSTYSTGTGMVNNQDPLFVNSADPDGADNVWMTADDGLRLKPTSSAVDVGRNDSIPSGITSDILGSTRIQNTTVNMGAYEDTLVSCQLGSMLPCGPGLYISAYVTKDGSYNCYCDTFGNFILALDTTGTGAVIARDSVQLQIGTDMLTGYTNAGGIITNTNGGVVFNRKWNVNPTTQPTSDVKVRYAFTDVEYEAVKDSLAGMTTTVTSPDNLQMYKLTNGSAFADPHASGITGVVLDNGSTPSGNIWKYIAHSNGTDHSAEFMVSSFSGGGAGGGATGLPVPVELTYFRVTKQNDNSALLEWQTATELNNEKFEIERQIPGTSEFEKVGEVTGAGNLQKLMDYAFVDDISALSGRICYRIKQVDYDRGFEYSEIRCISKIVETQVLVYPNPVSDVLNIELTDEQNEYTIQIISLSGVVVKEHQTISFTQINLSDLGAGIYFVQGHTKGGKAFAQKLVIQH